MAENGDYSFRNLAGEEKESDDVLQNIEMLACFIFQDGERDDNSTLFLPYFPKAVFLRVFFIFFEVTGFALTRFGDPSPSRGGFGATFLTITRWHRTRRSRLIEKDRKVDEYR